ncbi:MAG: IS1595 family transposase [Methylocella sp.]
MSDAEVEAKFCKVRWPETDGAPVCPSCGGLNAYECRRPSGSLRFRCRACKGDFSITSGKLFTSHKLPLRGCLAAIAIFCNEVKGKTALAISRDLGLSYKTAFVLLHKLREAMAEGMKGRKLGGDGVVIIRERNGRSLPAVFRTERQALSFIRSRIAKGTIINADEGSSWDALHAQYEMKRINHEEAYSLDGACTNWAEEFFSRMRRAEQGHHHLLRYAQDVSWREDHRRISNGDQVHLVSGLAMKRGPSVDFCGYWQRGNMA